MKIFINILIILGIAIFLIPDALLMLQGVYGPGYWGSIDGIFAIFLAFCFLGVIGFFLFRMIKKN